MEPSGRSRKNKKHELKVLNATRDKADGQYSIYFEVADLIGSFKPAVEIRRVQRDIDGYEDTIRWLKGDYTVKPYASIANASEMSLAFFRLEFPGEVAKRYKSEYLKYLPKEVAKFRRWCVELQQVINACDAGLFQKLKGRVKRLIYELHIVAILGDVSRISGELPSLTMGEMLRAEGR